nr:MAG TPA: hyaluronidase [Caudoviricetes sp.]
MANTTLDVKIQIRNDTKNNWTTQNPVLLKGEMGVETDTRKFKFGDGVSDWKTLEYASATGAIIMNKAPTPTDSGYDVGAMWVDTAANKAYLLFNNTTNQAVWKQLVTPDDLSDLGAGDMLKSQFANNPKAEQGYVNAAIVADTANATTGTLTAGSKTFNGSANVTVTADDLGALTAVPSEYVKNTDYGTAETGGVVKSTAKGTDTVTIGADGTMTIGKASEAVAADTATTLATGRTISVAGDATGTSPVFDGSANVTIPLVLANSGVVAGTFTKVTVDAKGRVTEGVANLTAADIPELTLAKISDAGTAAAKDFGTAEGNVPVLGAGGKLSEAVIPAIAITDTFVVDSQAAMLALEAQQGDVAVRTDVNKTFILKVAPASTLANWVELETPTDAVTSVNGLTGAVTLTTSEVAEGSNLYFTTARANANWITHASTELTDSDTLLRTTDTLILNGGNA